ncbi:MAG: hypothetical protein Q4D89_10305 [Arachnia propionica]|uniref:hypothetical protein n=1 Tax=Arachnia propionica TaxID=1750 RepID=UPI002703731C|nr:hypothetical protein [Arachnia propionica]
MKRSGHAKQNRTRQGPPPPGPAGPGQAPAATQPPPPGPVTSRPTRASDAPEPEMHPAAIVEPAEATELRVNRVWLGLVVAMLGAWGAVGTLIGVEGGLWGVVIAVALHTVPGVAIGVMAQFRGTDLVLSWLIGSVGVLILVSLPAALTHLWYPRPMAALILLVSAGAAMWGARQESARFRLSHVGLAMRYFFLGPTGLATAGFVIAVATAASRPQLPAPHGAAIAAGPVWFLGLAVLVVAVCWSFSRTKGLGWTVVLLSMVAPVSQAFMYGTPTVQVAARHIGVTELIIQQGGLDRTQGIYQAYAGLFSSGALVQQAAGWADLLGYAAFFGAAWAGVNCLVVAALARYFVDEERAWWAALVFALGSSLTTSFYAPQVIGFSFVTVAFLALLRNTAGFTWSRVWLALLMAVVVAPTHQLSPFMAALVCGALVFARFIKGWWTPLLLVAPATVWALLNRGVLTRYVEVDELFNILANFRSPERPISTALTPDLTNRLTFLVPSAALVGIGVAALVALVRYRGRMTLGLLLAAASPIGLFFASSYGSEGIFRVALFSLPWLAILGSINMPTTGRRFWSAPWHPVRNLVVVVLTSVFVLGTTGMDQTRVINRHHVAAIQWLESEVTDQDLTFTLGSQLAEPLQISGRQQYYIARDLLLRDTSHPIYPATTGAAYDPEEDLDLLMGLWLAEPGERRFVLATDMMKKFDERYGQQRVADQTRLEEALRARPGVSVVHEGPGVTIYQLPEGGAR